MYDVIGKQFFFFFFTFLYEMIQFSVIFLDNNILTILG